MKAKSMVSVDTVQKLIKVDIKFTSLLKLKFWARLDQVWKLSFEKVLFEKND